jgi:excisionase family DNA binding protein
VIPTPIDELDKPRTYGDAAHALGVRYHTVQRAARRGLVPTYRLGTSRRYVKLRDFLELMERSTKR